MIKSDVRGLRKWIGLVVLIYCGILIVPQGVTAQDEMEILGPVDLLTLKSNSVQPCIVHLPIDYDANLEYPLVVGFHGYGSNIDRFHTNWFAFDNPQFIYASVQAPYPSIQPYGLGFGWFLNGTGDPGLEMEVIGLTHDYALDAVTTLTDNYKVGEVHLLGFSQGAMLGLLLAMENPELVNGLGFLSSRIDPWLDNKTLLNNLPDDFRIFMAHGLLDEAVTIEEARSAQDLMESANIEVTFVEFDGDHTIPAEILRGFETWLMEEINHE